MAMKLRPGASIRFQHVDEDSITMEYFIMPVSFQDSDCLYTNCVGGGRPLVIDVTTYDSGLKKISAELDQYINYATGNYGYVNILECAGPCGSGQTRSCVFLEKSQIENIKIITYTYIVNWRLFKGACKWE